MIETLSQDSSLKTFIDTIYIIFIYLYIPQLRFVNCFYSFNEWMNLHIYIVKRRCPRFVGDAIEILLIDWLIKYSDICLLAGFEQFR